MTTTARRTFAVAALALAAFTVRLPAANVDAAPSKETLTEASKDDCEAISSVVQRCAPRVGAPTTPVTDDALAKSRAKTKAGFDRIDQQGRDDALKGLPPTVNTPVGDAQQLGGVTVTGKSNDDKSIGDTLQRALGQPTGVSNGNGTVSKYAPNGTRYDCIEKCVGPACCVEVRAIPNPAREVNSIGR